MSKATHAAVEEAVRAHMADEYDDPRLLTDWVVLIANQGLETTHTGYFYISPVGTSAHVLTGLIAHFLNDFRYKHALEARDSE